MVDVSQAAEAIATADAILVCAGAGMGVDSGLPDFRGNDGFWEAYPPFAKLGYSFIEMANPGWFARDPCLAWGFYGHRLKLYRETTPHQGFEILLQWGSKKPGGYFVFTSNVDGQFQKAGFEEAKIHECHGSIHYLQCSQSCGSAIWPAKDISLKVDEKSLNATEPLPTCPSCGATARPNVLMFGDWHWIPDRYSQQESKFEDWLYINNGAKIVVVECGAGTGVPTVRMTSESILANYSARLVRINIRESAVPAGELGFPTGALETLKKIEKKL